MTRLRVYAVIILLTDSALRIGGTGGRTVGIAGSIVALCYSCRMIRFQRALTNIDSGVLGMAHQVGMAGRLIDDISEYPNRFGSESGDVPGTSRALRLLSRLMPAELGHRWLAEAGSIVFETPPQLRSKVIHSYLRTAPRVIGIAWTSHPSRIFAVNDPCLTGRIDPQKYQRMREEIFAAMHTMESREDASKAVYEILKANAID